MFDNYMRSIKDAVMVPFLAFVTSYRFSPNYLTVLRGIVGVYGLYYVTLEQRYVAIGICVISQILDGLDGAYARATKQVSDFGGYLDILVDFTFYGLIPLAVTSTYPSHLAWIVTCLLEVTFFVNAAGLFFLSALIEKNTKVKQAYLKKGKKE